MSQSGANRHTHPFADTIAAKPSLSSAADRWRQVSAELKRNWIFWLGLAAFTIPTLIGVALDGWASEQGAHALIVLATGAWVVWGLAPQARAIARPAPAPVFLAVLAPFLLLYLAARLTGLIELEGLAVYGALVAILYSNGGLPILRALWFPLAYFLFLIPIPQSLIDTMTQPLKIGISNAAVSLLSNLGYPVAGSGVKIYIGQFELLIAAACAGLNSLISLTAIGIFYVYILHRANWRYTLLLIAAVVPVAILANYVRVLVLILTTYYLGEAAAQGFLHEFAGLTMFAVAVLSIFALDRLATPLRRRLERAGANDDG